MQVRPMERLQIEGVRSEIDGVRRVSEIDGVRRVQEALREMRAAGPNRLRNLPVITVDPDGNIRAGRADPEERAVVQAAVFSVDPESPTGVRRIVGGLGFHRRNREAQDHVNFDRPLLEVDDDGDINDDVEGEARLRAQVLADKFSHYPGLQSDRRKALEHINHVIESVYQGYHGFQYRRSYRGVSFEFFSYFYPPVKGYKVMVLSPRLNGKVEAHPSHLLSDGHICMDASGTGLPDLVSAYGRSCFWAEGFANYMKTGEFPWD